MLKIYKSPTLLVFTVLLSISHAQAATNSKVRLAANLGARAIKATVATVKEHPFLALAGASTGYVIHQHGKFRRAISWAEKRQRKMDAAYSAYHRDEMAKLTQKVTAKTEPIERELETCRVAYATVTARIPAAQQNKSALFNEQLKIGAQIDQLKANLDANQEELQRLQAELKDVDAKLTAATNFLDNLLESQRNIGSRKQELEKQLKEWAEYLTDEIKKINIDSNNYAKKQAGHAPRYAQTAEDAKLAAERADRMTFKEFLSRINRQPLQNNFAVWEIVLLAAPLAAPLSGFVSLPLLAYTHALQFGIYKALGKVPFTVPEIDGWGFVKAQMVVINNWQDAENHIKKGLNASAKLLGAITVVSAAASTAIIIKKWLRARERAAAGQP